MENNAELKEYLDILKSEVDKSYYIGPTLTFLTGVGLGLTPNEPGFGLLDVTFMGTIFVGIAWFIFRAIKKGRAEKKYQEAFNQYLLLGSKMENNPEFKDSLEILKDEADKFYYVGPALTFLTGVALGLTQADPKIGLLDVVFVGALFVGIAWFIFRAIKKGRAEKKYEAAFNQYYKEFIRGE